MTLASELESMIRSYVMGAVSRAELQTWLDTHVQETADSGDRTATDLSDRAWILLSELGYGQRSEESVRSELKQCLAVRAS